MKKLLDSSPYSSQILHDDGDGKVHVESRFDCQPALDAAAAARDAGQKPGSEMKHIGEVPMWLVHLSIKEGWYNDKARWRSILKEHSKFQVHKD